MHTSRIRMFTLLATILCLAASPLSTSQGGVVDFQDLSLGSNSYENGSNLKGSFTSGGATFNNYYDTTYQSWEGWAYSNQTDSSTAGFGNQYSAYLLPSQGASTSNQFAIAYTQPYTLQEVVIDLPAGQRATSIDMTNVTYSALIMRDGDQQFHYSRQFVDGDWFKVTITGEDGAGKQVGTPVDFYLADYRGVTGPNYIVSAWTTVDLTPLGDASRLVFTEDSTDRGDYGVNTPTYVAVDNLVLAVAAPEPSTWLLMAAGFSALLVFTRRVRR